MVRVAVQIAAGCGEAVVCRCVAGVARSRTPTPLVGPRFAGTVGGGLRALGQPLCGPRAMTTREAVQEERISPLDSKPIVKIDNMHDPFATIVTVRFGNVLGDLVETIGALKNLGLNIKRAKLDTNDPSSKHRFYITDSATSEKIVKSSQLEKIRLTILEILTRLYPESGAQLNFGNRVRVAEPHDLTDPLGLGHRTAVETTIRIEEDATGSHSEVFITTQDRPGLLVDIVSVLKDLNVNVVSAEVDTVGTEAQDEFFVTYHGEPLTPPMEELVRNALQYYLSLAYIEREESY